MWLAQLAVSMLIIVISMSVGLTALAGLMVLRGDRRATGARIEGGAAFVFMPIMA